MLFSYRVAKQAVFATAVVAATGQAAAQDPKDAVTTHLTTHAFSTGLTEAKELLKGRKAGDSHPLVDPQGFREQRLVVERAKKPD